MGSDQRLLRGGGGLWIAASILVMSIYLAQTEAYPSQVSKYINSMEQDVDQGAAILRQILAMEGKMKQEREALEQLIADMERVMPAYMAGPRDNIRMTRKRNEPYGKK